MHYRLTPGPGLGQNWALSACKIRLQTSKDNEVVFCPLNTSFEKNIDPIPNCNLMNQFLLFLGLFPYKWYTMMLLIVGVLSVVLNMIL